MTDRPRKRQLNKLSPCFGCGRQEIHKKCPAHGTLIYCNPEHPEWGKASDERFAELRLQSKEKG